MAMRAMSLLTRFVYECLYRISRLTSAALDWALPSNKRLISDKQLVSAALE